MTTGGDAAGGPEVTETFELPGWQPVASTADQIAINSLRFRRMLASFRFIGDGVFVHHVTRVAWRQAATGAADRKTKTGRLQARSCNLGVEVDTPKREQNVAIR
jgi:hypothetical protein